MYQPPTNSLDRSKRKHNAGLSLNVGVEDTKNVLEVGRHHQRHGGVGLLSETSTHSTISELLSRNKRIVHQEFLKGQCSGDRLLVLLGADPGVGVRHPGIKQVLLPCQNISNSFNYYSINCHFHEIISTTEV